MKNPHAASNVNDKDERQHRFTPRKLIQALHKEFQFTMDACGHPLSPASQIIGRGYTLVRPSGMLTYGNCYGVSWATERVFLQPDFSRIPEAVRAANFHMMVGKWCELVVLLIPWNRQEQEFWQEHIEPFRDGKSRGRSLLSAVETRALRGRVKFGTPSDPEGTGKHPVVRGNEIVMRPNAPGFGCGLVIWRRKV